MIILVWSLSILCAVLITVTVINYKDGCRIRESMAKMKTSFEEIDTLVFDSMHGCDAEGRSMAPYDSEQVQKVWDTYNQTATEFRRAYRFARR